ncbi:hypothetical protein HZH68_011520 [Vespula germanica]|uniref:Uncharacterized protein n=1 Tax=Vespula germanica TaxID=30212 RepID=A0A834JRD1_VESGE|nr:hypothetical protein HZH68_011520 [Vespula germanica]
MRCPRCNLFVSPQSPAPPPPLPPPSLSPTSPSLPLLLSATSSFYRKPSQHFIGLLCRHEKSPMTRFVERKN